MLLVPIGGGSSASGCTIVRTAVGSRAKVIGVQADTFAEGMATRVTFDLTFNILKRGLDDIVTLTEDELAGGFGREAA